MLNFIWISLICASITLSLFTGTTTAVVQSITASCKIAVNIAIGLIGVMSLWLGLMKVAESAGLINIVAKLIGPLLRKLFPKVPAEHPAMGSMIMNISANMLGIGNAATPFGLRAMENLQKLNPFPDTASNAMCTFLAINTSSVQLVPVTAIAILAATGDPNPTSIIFPALLATSCSTIAGIIAVKTLEKLPLFKQKEPSCPPTQ
jgi:spore maturation protein A